MLNLLLLSLVGTGGFAQPGQPARQADSIRVALEPHDGFAMRPQGIKSLLLPRIKTSRHGTITVGDDQIDVYLPKLSKYPLTNAGAGDDSIRNKAAYIYLDQNSDGVLALDEVWFCNLPVRIKDSMFDISAIGDDQTWIEFTPSDAPISGSIVGHSAPPFEMTDMDGQVLTNESFLGRYLVIDVWSPT